MSPSGLVLPDRPRSFCPGGGVSVGEDGVVDSLRSLLLDDRYGAPGSAERVWSSYWFGLFKNNVFRL
jgi:hypothetical protein